MEIAKAPAMVGYAGVSWQTCSHSEESIDDTPFTSIQPSNLSDGPVEALMVLAPAVTAPLEVLPIHWLNSSAK